MLFKHYNNQFESFGNAYSGYNWRSTYYPSSGNAYDDDPSAAANSLLISLLNSPSSTTYYSRPGAFSDLRITKADQICNGCDPIVFDDLRLMFNYSYFENPNSDRSFNTVAIRPDNKSLNPYYILDKEDKNGRQDGRGNFFRFYNNSTNKLQVSAPEQYGNYIFQYWLKNTEGKNIDTVKSANIIITLNKNYELTTYYERIQPVLSVNPDTITFNYAAHTDTLNIKNIGTGEMEWFTENENEWITILNKKVGVNDYDLTFTVSTNNSDTTRTGKIYIYANESLKFADSVVIVQSPPESMVNFSLPKGWAGISTWLKPLQPAVETMFSQVEDQLVILQNFEGVYWPEQNVNTIQNWEVTSGYMIKMESAAQINLPGTHDVQQTLGLGAGWKLIPVLTDCNIETSELLQNTNFTIIKEVAGTNLYWPQFGINTLEYLQSGKSYFLLLNDTATLNYAGCKQFKTAVNIGNSYNSESPWNNVAATPVSHVFAIQHNSPEVSHIGTGNIIGVFNTMSQCCGFVEYGVNNALIAFKDDATTETADGLNDGEKFSMRLYRKDNKLSYELFATYDEKMITHDGTFATNGLSVITGFKVGEIIIDEYSLKAVELFPNPTRDILQINNVFPISLQYTIQSVNGKELLKGLLFEGLNSIDLSSFESGVFIVTIANGNSSLSKRIIKN